jgi:hypothetical protein
MGCDGCQSLRHVVGSLLEKEKIRIDTFAAAALNPVTLSPCHPVTLPPCHPATLPSRGSQRPHRRFGRKSHAPSPALLLR